MKIKWILCLCFIFSFENCIKSQFRWETFYYSNYDYKSFSKSKLANQKIDFRNIDYPLLHAAIFYETNRQRIEHRKATFKHSQAMEEAARQHSIDMVQLNFFSHDSPMRGKKTLSERLAQVGINNAYKGENIATFYGLDYDSGKPVFAPPQNGGFFSYVYKGEPLEPNTYLSAARTVVKNWMSSAGHRENILNENFKFLGVGVAFFEDRNFYKMPTFKATQNFASEPGE